MEENKYEIYRITPNMVGPWIDEIIVNKRLLHTISRSNKGSIMELRFIFKENSREKRNFKNVEQWTSVPCKLPDKE